MNDASILIGLTLTGVTFDEDSITFYTEEKGAITAYACGDCCSHSWVESVDQPARGYPAKVLDVRDVNLPQTEGSRSLNEWDYRQYYGLRVITDNGDIDIDYRNDSNGYYGGWLQFLSN